MVTFSEMTRQSSDLTWPLIVVVGSLTALVVVLAWKGRSSGTLSALPTMESAAGLSSLSTLSVAGETGPTGPQGVPGVGLLGPPGPPGPQGNIGPATYWTGISVNQIEPSANPYATVSPVPAGATNSENWSMRLYLPEPYPVTIGLVSTTGASQTSVVATTGPNNQLNFDFRFAPGPIGPTGPVGCPAGAVVMWTTSVAPPNFVLCDGTSYSISDSRYSALYAVIGTTFNTTSAPGFFAVPDLRDRFVVGASAGVGRFPTPSSIGQTVPPFGRADGTIILEANEMPVHNHPITFSDVEHRHTIAPHTHNASVDPHTHNFPAATSNNTAAVGEPNAGYTAQFETGVTETQNSSNVTVALSQTLVTEPQFTGLASSNFMSATAGGNMPVNILPPALALVYIIKL